MLPYLNQADPGLNTSLSPCTNVVNIEKIFNILYYTTNSLFDKMAGHKMTWLNLSKLWCHLSTDVHAVAASGTESTPFRWVYRTFHISLEDDPLVHLVLLGIRDGYG